MTHTLHPEIEKAVTELAESVANEIYKVPTPAGIDFVKGVIKDELGPYLNMPQPIENEPKVCTACLGHKTHSKYTASKGTIEVNCSRCKGTGQEPVYDAKPKTYTLEQMEEEYDRGFTNGLLVMGGKKNDLKQSTPQIEKINIAFLEGCGEQTVWEQPIIVKKINEIIDYINNTLPTSKDA